MAVSNLKYTAWALEVEHFAGIGHGLRALVCLAQGGAPIRLQG